VKSFRWSAEKNAELMAERGVGFEQMVVAIEGGGILDIVSHPNPGKYPNQKVMIIAWADYAHLVPFVEEADHYFLKTVIPSRKATRDFLKKGESDGD
jgi:hypothetical protein